MTDVPDDRNIGPAVSQDDETQFRFTAFGGYVARSAPCPLDLFAGRPMMDRGPEGGLLGRSPRSAPRG
jgi:hypothetical protein